MNAFDKLKVLKEQVNSVFPEMDMEGFSRIVAYLGNCWHGKKRKKNAVLTKEQLTVYELLIREGYNPSTVYRWTLLATSSREVREMVRNDEISIRQALKLRRQNKELVTVTEKQFINAIIQCVEEYVSEPGEKYPGRMNNGKY